MSQGIYFSDEQLKVYSIKISELLSRCLTEIESLYKDLYRREAGKSPDNVGEAWRFLNLQWQLDHKELAVMSDNFFFDDSFHPYFAPFSYRNGSEDDFYSAYNSVKHDRAKNLSKANLNVLIRSLGALYILNIYYSNENLNSSVFEAKTAGLVIGIFMDLDLDLSDFMSSCLFIAFLEYDYYLWQENSSSQCKEMMDKLSEQDKDSLRKNIFNNSSEIFFILNRLLQLYDSSISVGDMLKKSHSIAQPLANGEAKEVVNIGYSKVYLNVEELQVEMSELNSGKKIVALENLKNTAFKRLTDA